MPVRWLVLPMSDHLASATGKRHLHPLLKLALEIGPLVAFFIANARGGIFAATGTFMAALVVALAVSWIFTRHLPVLPVVTAAFVLVFGGLTLWLQDELFIKLKPTIVNGLFAAILLGGLVFRRALLQPVLDSMFRLTEEGWRQLTLRWGLFFLLLALLNELVWRNASTDMWVNFKVFGIMPLTLIFSLSQMPLMKRHALRGDDGEPGDGRATTP